jgi:RNA polymerase sigma-70 factor (ECF subfamily)
VNSYINICSDVVRRAQHNVTLVPVERTNPMTTVSDEYLVVVAQSGGHWAYLELCERYRNLMFHVVHQITKNCYDTEDVVQDALMKAFVHIKTFDGRSAFPTWLTRIAINSALMLIRKRRCRKEDSLDDPSDADQRSRFEIVEPSHNPEERYIRMESQLRVRQAIRRLSPKLRKVAEIRQSQDGSIAEIAMVAGLSVSATKSRLSRARRALRQSLAVHERRQLDDQPS